MNNGWSESRHRVWSVAAVPVFACMLAVVSSTALGTDLPSSGEFLAGMWSGEAQVEEQVFLQGGSFPATVALAQSGNRVRGILDVQQEAGLLAEAFGYLFDGVREGDQLHLELTDRMCGAGDPIDLCYPAGTVQRVFSARGQILGTRMIWDSVEVLDGVTYPPGVAIEIPFEELDISVETQPAGLGGRESSIDEDWAGPCYLPMSVVYELPLPMYGYNEMTIESVQGEPTITRFDNEGINIVPAFDDIIIADSFAYDEQSANFWFVQLHTLDSRWLYVGRRHGSMATGLVVFDNYADPYFDDNGTPIDPMETDLLDVAGVFYFVSDIFRDGFESGDTSAWSWVVP